MAASLLEDSNLSLQQEVDKLRPGLLAVGDLAASLLGAIGAVLVLRPCGSVVATEAVSLLSKDDQTLEGLKNLAGDDDSRIVLVSELEQCLKSTLSAHIEAEQIWVAPITAEKDVRFADLFLVFAQQKRITPLKQQHLDNVLVSAAEILRPLQHKITHASHVSEQKFDAILSSVEAGLFAVEACRNHQGEIIDFMFQEINAAAELMLGYSQTDIYGKRLLDLFPEVLDVGLFEDYVSVLDTGCSKVRELSFPSETGADWFHISIAPVGDHGLAVAFTDISDHKRRERALHDLVSITPIARKDLKEYLHKMLELGVRVFGASHGFISNIKDDVYHIKAMVGDMDGVSVGDDLKLPETLCAAVVLQQTALAFHNMKSSDFVRHPAMPENSFGIYAGAPIFVGDRLYGTISLVSDDVNPSPYQKSQVDFLKLLAFKIQNAIELNNALEEALDLSDELRTVLDNVPATIWYKDGKNNILQANARALKSVNETSLEAVIGKNTSEFFPEMADKYLQDDLSVIASGKPRRNIIESYAPANGEQGWISTDKIPMTDRHGNVRILAVATDITELKRNEERLERLNTNLSQFAFIAAHDLQAPLSQVSMYLELLRTELGAEGVTLNADSDTFLFEAFAGIKRMRSMVRSLYDLFRLDGQFIQKELTDLNEVVQAAEQQSRTFLDDASAVVQAMGLRRMRVNKDLMAQVFQNLIVNACKYAQSDELKIRIYDGRDVERRKYFIFVEDNGKGIPLPYQKTVFEPFRRLVNDKAVSGAGIGLAFCRKVAALHDADLYLDPDFQDGARFVLAFDL